MLLKRSDAILLLREAKTNEVVGWQAAPAARLENRTNPRRVRPKAISIQSPQDSTPDCNIREIADLLAKAKARPT